MANVEKTVEILLKKFDNKTEYEKRKIVFWYDNEKTVWSEIEQKPTEDFDAIVKTIKRLSADTEASKKIGNNARNYVINQFSMEKVMLDFSAKVEKIIKIN